jgi:hypothetical protein
VRHDHILNQHLRIPAWRQCRHSDEGVVGAEHCGEAHRRIFGQQVDLAAAERKDRHAIARKARGQCTADKPASPHYDDAGRGSFQRVQVFEHG